MSLMGEGIHRARAIASHLPDVKPGKTPSVVVTFKNFEGETIDAWLYLSDRALERTEKALRTCGWYGNDISECMRDGLGLNEVELVVEDEEYQGKVRSKVKWINPLRKEMPDDAKKALVESLKAKFKPIEVHERQPGEDDDFA